MPATSLFFNGFQPVAVTFCAGTTPGGPLFRPGAQEGQQFSMRHPPLLRWPGLSLRLPWAGCKGGMDTELFETEAGSLVEAAALSCGPWAWDQTSTGMGGPMVGGMLCPGDAFSLVIVCRASWPWVTFSPGDI